MTQLTPATTRRAAARRPPHAGARSRGCAERDRPLVLAAAEQQQLSLPGERLAADLIRELALEITGTRARLAALDDDLQATLAKHPDAALILSLPGIGATLTAEFIAEAGTIDRFPSAAQLAAAAGLIPVLKPSGRTRYLQRAHGGKKTLKRVFFQSALCSLSCPASREYYARERRERKTHHQAVIALARRRVDVLYAMLRDRQPYELRAAAIC